MGKQARKKPARRKNKLPEWADPNFIQKSTGSTRTFNKTKSGTKKSRTKWVGRTKGKAVRDVLGK